MLIVGVRTTAQVYAQETALPPAPTFSLGTVENITSETTTHAGGYPQTTQELEITLSDTTNTPASYQLPLGAGEDRLLRVGQRVILTQVTQADGTSLYEVNDLYRLPATIAMIVVFFAVILVLSRGHGVAALGGLAFSIWLLIMFVVPQLAHGATPIVISAIATFLIAISSLLVAHGFTARSVVSLISTLITLVFAMLTALIFVQLTQLFGLGSDEGIELQYGALAAINLRGLLLAGMLIGALGVLDDITTAQTAAIEELHRANPALTVRELYARGMSIGREHITSLVNTLALAYAGASLPMLLVFQLYQQPLWVTLNSEFVVEEVVRTIVGSMALAVAVPITTWLAAKWFVQWFPDSLPANPQKHYHSH